MNTLNNLKKLKKFDLIKIILNNSSSIFKKTTKEHYTNALQNTLDLYRKNNKKLKDIILGNQSNYVWKHYETIIASINYPENQVRLIMEEIKKVLNVPIPDFTLDDMEKLLDSDVFMFKNIIEYLWENYKFVFMQEISNIIPDEDLEEYGWILCDNLNDMIDNRAEDLAEDKVEDRLDKEVIKKIKDNFWKCVNDAELTNNDLIEKIYWKNSNFLDLILENLDDKDKEELKNKLSD